MFPVSDIPNRCESLKFEVTPSFDAIYFPSTNASTHCANPWDLFCQQVDRQVGGYVTISLVTTSISLPHLSHLL